MKFAIKFKMPRDKGKKRTGSQLHQLLSEWRSADIYRKSRDQNHNSSRVVHVSSKMRPLEDAGVQFRGLGH